MTDFLSMVCPPGTSCPLASGFGLPEVLLWVLTFALLFTALQKLKIMDKKPAALVALALGFFVLMAVPATLITAIAGMSTGFIALMIGAVIVFALLIGVLPETLLGKDKDGKPITYNFVQMHGTSIAIVMILAAALIFWTYGGAELIGITSLPSIGAIPWILVIIGIAVLWMLS